VSLYKKEEKSNQIFDFRRFFKIYFTFKNESISYKIPLYLNISSMKTTKKLLLGSMLLSLLFAQITWA